MKKANTTASKQTINQEVKAASRCGFTRKYFKVNYIFQATDTKLFIFRAFFHSISARDVEEEWKLYNLQFFSVVHRIESLLLFRTWTLFTTYLQLSNPLRAFQFLLVPIHSKLRTRIKKSSYTIAIFLLLVFWKYFFFFSRPISFLKTTFSHPHATAKCFAMFVNNK